MKNLMNSIDKINTVAGLSDPILSGWSPANNVQTPAADWWSAPHLNSYWISAASGTSGSRTWKYFGAGTDPVRGGQERGRRCGLWGGGQNGDAVNPRKSRISHPAPLVAESGKI